MRRCMSVIVRKTIFLLLNIHYSMMSGSNPKPNTTLLYLLFIVTITASFKLSYCNAQNINKSILCPEIEKQALLSFKESVNDTSSMLSSWKMAPDADCCLWDHVVCSNSTGHIHELHLQNDDYDSVGLQGKLNPSLLNLTRLKYLDLSWNHFNDTIPSFIWSFASLRYLKLSGAGFHGFSAPSNEQGTFGSSLMINLKYLNLSFNPFEGTIPSFLGLLTSLEYLDLSDKEQEYMDRSRYSFQGSVPPSIGNLTNLRFLNLGYFSKLSANSLEWLRGLSRLESLNLNSIDLRGVTDWAQVINSLPSLVELHLSKCRLNFSAANPLINDVANISTSLAILDLSSNRVEESQDRYIVPGWIFQLRELSFLDLRSNFFEGPLTITSNTTKLQYIDLSHNNFTSPISDWLYGCNRLESMTLSQSSLQGMISNAIGNLSSLRTLDLSHNDLSGEIPREIAKLCRLHTLNLAWNKLQGEISHVFGSKSDCLGKELESLDLSYNQLSGHLLGRIGEFSRLKTLYLTTNFLSGPVPSTLGNLQFLRALSLENNKFTGNLPESFGQLSSLEFVMLDNNMFEGEVTENHFLKLTNLSTFLATGNHLALKVNPDWVPPFKLRHIGMGSWSLSPEVPDVVPGWLETQKDNLEALDLSNTGISFHVPNWLWEIPVLNISHNKLHGTIPDISNGSKYGIYRSIFVRSNQFNGSLPQVAGGVGVLDLSDNSFSGGLSRLLCGKINKDTTVLLLGGNSLSGKLPDCSMKWPLLEVLNIENNNLSGHIPSSIGLLQNLRYLDLKNNSLSDRIPSSMQNCTNLEMIDLSFNKFIGNIPEWMGIGVTNLRILILRENKLSGKIPSNICHLSSLQILDLSGNSLSGIIHSCVSNLSAMVNTESNNELMGYMYNGSMASSPYYFESASITTKGREQRYDTILGLVTSIDLSRNNLSGVIPQQLSHLVKLRSLNLSGNHFTGMIPIGTGNMTQLESLDLSRNNLSGEIPNSFTLLSSLNYLNLSYNNLTGSIPQSTQILGFPASCFIGNTLCGPPLTKNCSSKAGIPSHGPGYLKENGEIDWFYIFLASGYTVGFSVVCTTLVLKKSWSDVCFGFMEDMWNKIFVFVKVRCSRSV